MGTIIEFPAGRRQSSSGQNSPTAVAPRAETGTVLILPVIRIERDTDETKGGRGPQEGAAPGRRRRRR